MSSHTSNTCSTHFQVLGRLYLSLISVVVRVKRNQIRMHASLHVQKCMRKAIYYQPLKHGYIKIASQSSPANLQEMPTFDDTTLPCISGQWDRWCYSGSYSNAWPWSSPSLTVHLRACQPILCFKAIAITYTVTKQPLTCIYA